MGEADFRAGQYQAAIGAFRHALIDEPNNAGLMLLIAQSLFQTGHWTEAAGATELAMGALPEDKWGTVVQNYTQLYGNIEDYTKQLKALEAAVKQKPDDPAMRFLLGFHFGYLNYPQEAVRELSEAVRLEPRDPAARRLHDVFGAKTGAQPVGPVPESLAAAPNASPSAKSEQTAPPQTPASAAPAEPRTAVPVTPETAAPQSP
jgi:tetratricopeptide (TPR) repeat protein